jgi:hypothetical protein
MVQYRDGEARTMVTARQKANGQKPPRGGVRIITPLQHHIVEAVGRYHFLTPALTGWLLGYRPTSQRHLEKQFKSLADIGLLLAVPQPRFGRHGRPSMTYCLSNRGRNYLRDHDIPVKTRFHPSEMHTYSWLWLTHTAYINSVLIAIDIHFRMHPDLRLNAMRHERDLRSHMATVTLASGTTRGVCPDAWLDFRLRHDERLQFPIAVELDRGTEHRGKWLLKAEALLRWANGPYREQFQAQALTVAVIATTGEQRATTLRAWTEELLGTLDATDDGDLFRFTGLRDGVSRAELEALFVSPRWTMPFTSAVLPLLDGTGVPHA